jgi:hypothetical protein
VSWFLVISLLLNLYLLVRPLSIHEDKLNKGRNPQAQSPIPVKVDSYQLSPKAASPWALTQLTMAANALDKAWLTW